MKPLLVANKERIEAFIEDVKNGSAAAINESKNAAMEQMNDPSNVMAAAKLASDAQSKMDAMKSESEKKQD